MPESKKMAAFWDTVLCSNVEVDRRFDSVYRLHQQGDRPDPRRLSLSTQFINVLYDSKYSRPVKSQQDRTHKRELHSKTKA
jgi:hypothetical protein